MSHQHPDPEGHLTDITLTALVRLRDALTTSNDPGEYWAGHREVTLRVLSELNTNLEPWGEGKITDD